MISDIIVQHILIDRHILAEILVIKHEGIGFFCRQERK